MNLWKIQKIQTGKNLIDATALHLEKKYELVEYSEIALLKQ